MLRVRTLYASSSGRTARYYTQYLQAEDGERPGTWVARQAAGLGISGPVEAEALEAVLSGHHPLTGERLGSKLEDRYRSNGKVIRAVAGFDATFSAPKSVSAWWGLTQDEGLRAAHDLAVSVVLDHIEAHATTRVRVNGPRAYPDVANGLAMAVFPQSTSREDDPQLHTHTVISTKVLAPNGRWYALDGHYVKNNQRALGGLYQSVLRAELTHRYGVSWGPIEDGQAEVTGMPAEILEVFSKRTKQVEARRLILVESFKERNGRDPTHWEHAAIKREAAADSRQAKTHQHVQDLAVRWRTEAAELGWTPERLTRTVTHHAKGVDAPGQVTVAQILDVLSAKQSTWVRADVLKSICDLAPVQPGSGGRGWARTVERVTDEVMASQRNLDPETADEVRASDGRSIWMDPALAHMTDDAILAQEDRIIAFAMGAQADEPAPSATVDTNGLDLLQAAAARGVAGHDRLVLVVGPAGTGKTTALARATADLHAHQREVFGIAPTARAARVLTAETGQRAETVAKLLHEWDRPTGPTPPYRLRPGSTLLVDESGMVGTDSLDRLVRLAEVQRWRLVMIGDPHQLQAVGRGGMFSELCRLGRTHQLATIHRFTNEWEQDATLGLRSGDPKALDSYLARDRIRPGTIDDHLKAIADAWITHHRSGDTVAVTAETNVQVNQLNEAIQARRRDAGHIDDRHVAAIAGAETAGVGDVVVSRRNDRTLHTSSGEPVRNREHWHVDHVHRDGSLTVTRTDGHGTIELPADYVQAHVRLGYAATAHGHQGDTVDASYTLVTTSTTHAGLYVGATRGRNENHLLAITDEPDLAKAMDLCRFVLTTDRADVPANVQRRLLAQQPAPPQRSRESDRAAVERAVVEAARRTAPCERAVREAEDDLTEAQQTLDALRHHAAAGPVWRRPSIRRQIPAAEERLDDCVRAHDSAVSAAQPTIDDLSHQIDNRAQDEQAQAISRTRQRLDHLQREPLDRGGQGLSR